VCIGISPCRLIAKPGSVVAGTPDNISVAAAGCACSSGSSVGLGSGPSGWPDRGTDSEMVTWHRVLGSESGESPRITFLADPRSECSFNFADMAKANGNVG